MNDEMPLAGKTFVFTGEMNMDREVAKSKVVMLGGRVTTQPSSKTDYMVIGTEPGPSKMTKAKELKIKIINEDKFVEMIQIYSKDFTDTMEVEKTNTIETQTNNNAYEPWCEKYRPTKKEDLVGNHALVESLTSFLQGKTKYKAALLSGHPGIGKTTAVQICVNDLGYDLIEFNASDTRNKSEIVRAVRLV
ncbi:DNA replication factor C complex subunit Rfc1 [Binucleata daphniae]